MSGSPFLVAVDFSSLSEDAVVWAARAAERFDAPLVVLHVVHDREAEPAFHGQGRASNGFVRLEDAAAERMDDFLGRLRQQYPRLLKRATPRHVRGLPAGRILEIAGEIGAQMIVMGSSARGAVARALRGSESMRVARRSTIPVTIVKGAIEETLEG